MTGISVLLRNEPVQARSNARLGSLLDATSSVIAEFGLERVTTAMIAERAGASIGTVYRYFPDRIAVLQAVAARNIEKFTERVHASIADARHLHWLDALRAVFDEYASAFANMPGFTAVRFGDVIDLRPHPNQTTGMRIIVDEIVARLSAPRYGLSRDVATADQLELAMTLVDGLYTRGFRTNPRGEQAYIREANALVEQYLIGVWGEPVES